MAGTSSGTSAALTQEILGHLGLASKTAAWGTLGTLRSCLSFSVDKDVQRLLRAVAGQGVDQQAIVDVLTNRSWEQRQLIARAFQERTQQDLLAALRAALSGPLERLVAALLQPAAQLDAQELRRSLKDPGSAWDVALEILATRSRAQLHECLAAYRLDFQVEAEEDIRAATGGPVRALLLALAQGRHESSPGVDHNLVEQDVQALAQVDGGPPEGPWVLVLTRRNPEHLGRVFDRYQQRTGHDLETGIRGRFRGEAQAALLSLAAMARSMPLFFADRLHRALQEPEPDCQALGRVLLSRSETDLLSIRAQFRRKFGRSLYSALQDAVTGDCRTALLAICRAEDL